MGGGKCNFALRDDSGIARSQVGRQRVRKLAEPFARARPWCVTWVCHGLPGATVPVRLVVLSC